MTKRDQILETAFKAFTSRGIKDVKVDDIASELKISKKTIYEFFNGKNDLLTKCLEWKLPQLLDRESKIIRCMPNPLTALVFCAVENIKFWSGFSDKFMEEVKEKNIMGEYGVAVRKEMSEHSSQLLDCCVSQGYLREEDSPKLIMVFMNNLSRMEQLRQPDVFPSQLCFDAVLTILSGLCTPKGRKVLDELRENYC